MGLALSWSLEQLEILFFSLVPQRIVELNFMHLLSQIDLLYTFSFQIHVSLCWVISHVHAFYEDVLCCRLLVDLNILSMQNWHLHKNHMVRWFHFNDFFNLTFYLIIISVMYYLIQGISPRKLDRWTWLSQSQCSMLWDFRLEVDHFLVPSMN